MSHLKNRISRWTAVPALLLALTVSAPSLASPAWAAQDSGTAVQALTEARAPHEASVAGVTVSAASAPSPSNPLEIRVGTLGWEIDTGGPGTYFDRFFPGGTD